jgi:hypothetical protein
MTTTAAPLPAEWIALKRRALIVGLVATAAFCIGGLFDPNQFFRAYLAAYLFYFGLPMGSMALLMIYYCTGGAWGFVIKRFLEAEMRTLPLAGLGFIPIGLGAGRLYPWANPAESNPLLEFQRHYLNLAFFWGRAVLFFALWLGLAALLGVWSKSQDRAPNPRFRRRFENLGGAGLVIYGVTLHFASLDWFMSLQPAFHSTIFAPIIAGGQLVSALALAILLLALLRGQPPLSKMVSAKVLTDLGNLLLSFVVVWTYLCWFQYMLSWIANLPVDAVWYMPRLRGSWQGVALLLVFLHFAAPFVLLLWRRIKRDLDVMQRLAGLLLLMQLVFAFYQVLPAFHVDRLSGHWMDFLAPLAMGGLWLAFFLWQLGERMTLPQNDFNEASAAHLRASDETEAAWEEALSHG